LTALPNNLLCHWNSFSVKTTVQSTAVCDTKALLSLLSCYCLMSSLFYFFPFPPPPFSRLPLLLSWLLLLLLLLIILSFFSLLLWTLVHYSRLVVVGVGVIW
jgi:hypothetical protein